MIPKIIHYCWFGKGEKPKLAQKCIASWKKYLYDYEFIEWNEDNFDIRCNKYVEEAYSSKKYAFVTDYVRLFALYNIGGIYMDTDVEVLTNYDMFLHHKAFSGFESDGNVPTGMMAAEKGNKWIGDLLKYYNDKRFIYDDGSYNMTTNTTIITNYMVEIGLRLDNSYQNFEGLVSMYPSDFFCPKDHRTGKIKLTHNSVCIHHFAGSWLEHKSMSYRLYKLKIYIMHIFGDKLINSIIYTLKLDKLKKRLFK